MFRQKPGVGFGNISVNGIQLPFRSVGRNIPLIPLGLFRHRAFPAPCFVSGNKSPQERVRPHGFQIFQLAFFLGFLWQKIKVIGQERGKRDVIHFFPADCRQEPAFWCHFHKIYSISFFAGLTRRSLWILLSSPFRQAVTAQKLSCAKGTNTRSEAIPVISRSYAPGAVPILTV